MRRKKPISRLSYPAALPSRCRACGHTEGLRIQLSTTSQAYRCGRCDSPVMTTRLVAGEEVAI